MFFRGKQRLHSCALVLLFASGAAQAAPRWMEALDRGVVAVPAIDGGVLVSWRLLGDDPADAAFNLYRDGKKLNASPLTRGTNYVDKTPRSGAYSVRRVSGGKEGPASPAAKVWAEGYLSIPIDPPPAGVTPSGEAYSYTANDASVGDLDGDGRYEIVLKWDPTNSKDNAFGGYTGNVYLDAYTLEGRRLWRIDLGRNIRAGAHYTQFQVYDYDGDGKAEIAARTSDGTVDGAGKALGDPNVDWRETGGERPQADRTGAEVKADGARVSKMQGRVLKGPEFLTLFEGATGKALAGTAYLDGQRPSIIMGRGYYGRSTIAAWDYRDGKLTQRWLFDSAAPGNAAYGGQGNHQLSVADVDDDGRDEIIYGSMALDDDGKGLWSARLFHGDAMHVGDLDPTHPGLEKFGVHEEMRNNGGIGAAMLDARTGKVLWSTPSDHDTGRGLTADIDPRYPGEEAWGANSDMLYTAQGKVIEGVKHPRQTNFAIWWDGDDLREFLDKNQISKWDWKIGQSVPLLTADGMTANNGTKATPALSADILGDWREEVIWRAEDNRSLRIYETPYPTDRRLVTLMHDPHYRVSIAWQNTAYNQPPHTRFYLGQGMKTPKPTAIVTRKASQ